MNLNAEENNDHPYSWDNSMLDVEITHIEHPGKFFCRLKEHITEYENFKRQLRSLYEPNEAIVQITSEKLAIADQKGLVVKHEGSYKRAKMLTVEDNDVTVFLLDEGGTVVISRNLCFFPAPHEYMKRPKFAFRCHIYEIKPKQSNGVDSSWVDEEAREYFKRELTKQRYVTLIRRAPENEVKFDGRPSLPVEISLNALEADDIWSRSKSVIKYISPMMVSNHFAVYRWSEPGLMESDDEYDENRDTGAGDDTNSQNK